MYPESRHLTEEQKDEMYGLFALNGSAARIVQHLEVKHNVHLQSQDVHSHRVSYRKELTAGFVQAMEFWKNYGILKRKFHIWKNYGI